MSITPPEPGSFEALVLPTELKRLEARRGKVFPGRPMPPLPRPEGKPVEGARAPSPDSCELAARYEDAHNFRALGLAFSGGGIRSATFNLGVLQGLAERDLLKYVDYLSTVSGGGYIGSWLHGVTKNLCHGDPVETTQLLSPVEHPAPGPPKDDPISFLRKYSNYLTPRLGLFSADSWVMGIIWLRNMLLNQLILLPSICAVVIAALLLVFVEQMSEDTSWPRLYTALNVGAAVAAVGALAWAAVILSRNLVAVVRETFDKKDDRRPLSNSDVARVELQNSGASVAALRKLGTAALARSKKVVGVVRQTFKLKNGQTPPHNAGVEHQSQHIVATVFVAAALIGCSKVGPLSLSSPTHWLVGLGVIALFALFQIRGGFIRCFLVRNPEYTTWAYVHVCWMVPLSAGVAVSLIFATWQAISWSPWNRVAFAPSLVCLSFLAGGTTLTGLMGVDYPDAAREWIARIAAGIALTCAAWSALFLVSVYGPWGFSWLLGNYGATGLSAAAAWALTVGGGVWAGNKSKDNKEGPKGVSPIDWLIGLAPTLFMIGYLLLISTGVHAALRGVTPHPISPVKDPVATATVNIQVPNTGGVHIDMGGGAEGWLATKLQPAARFAADYSHILSFKGPPAGVRWPRPTILVFLTGTRWDRPIWLSLFLGVCGFVATIASRRININEFSLHHFYKNRLVRCYLGASKAGTRRPNPLTGFDPKDDFRLADLVPNSDTEKDAGYLGPYAIINVTLNLNAGSELAQQERKGTSFFFTPEYCGFAASHTDEDDYQAEQDSDFKPGGFHSTAEYSHPLGPVIGTAMSISGAAASPNSGASTSGPMAFLLTVFDARLGAWLGNPRWEKASRLPGPLFALKYLFAELLGQTTGRSRFVNLSDGGHFENLGLYELVRRRCRYIIIGDAEQDGNLTFESLGGAIRKCRADFGVEIDLNPDPIRGVDRGFSKTHCVVGSITYPEVDMGRREPMCSGRNTVATDKARGWILYLKSSLTGDEPADVIEYRSRNASFPHESTADQFFSESQFESYRRLGLHVARVAFDDVKLTLETGEEQELLDAFQSLAEKWYAPVPVPPEAMSRLADKYAELMRILGSKTTLKPLFSELAEGKSSVPARTTPLDDECRTFLLEIMQLMQNVYTEFRLDSLANRANPRNAGWMSVFNRWSKSRAFEEAWNDVKKDYHPIFQTFIEKQLANGSPDVPIRQ